MLPGNELQPDRPPVFDEGEKDRFLPKSQRATILLVVSPEAPATGQLQMVRVIARPVVQGELGPPLLVGNVCGRGQARHGEFVMASGEMSERAYTDFLGKAFRNLAEHSRDGSIHYVCMDWRHLGEVLAAGQSVYSELKNLCVWSKTNGGMGSLYRSRHELVFVFKHGAAPHINNVELGRYGRNRTNVWEYAGVNAWGPDRLDDLALHPTVKPVAMIADVTLPPKTSPV